MFTLGYLLGVALVALVIALLILLYLTHTRSRLEAILSTPVGRAPPTDNADFPRLTPKYSAVSGLPFASKAWSLYEWRAFVSSSGRSALFSKGIKRCLASG